MLVVIFRFSKSNMDHLFRLLAEKRFFIDMTKHSDISVFRIIQYYSKLVILKPMQLPTILAVDEYKNNTRVQA